MLLSDKADTFTVPSGSGSGLGGAFTSTGSSTSSSFAGNGDIPVAFCSVTTGAGGVVLVVCIDEFAGVLCCVPFTGAVVPL
ncbi:hypothetical protein FUA48_14680 [Flavobacterium alkalisoli]|uniref:Uncharacterized protein n=1 Tax=Flavobacterium alkalisoli TaxID=2602769 RepID=A0A5B9G180_9FLAO|nr:hypothetical protein [Flavobacterium alkalisoli]QEE50777.1 hypothetical protein FUA48_14680 [Flavobacterium alkalisoli]